MTESVVSSAATPIETPVTPITVVIIVNSPLRFVRR